MSETAAMEDDGDSFSYSDAELVFGLVAPVGTDLDKFVEVLGVELRAFRYETNVVRVSEVAAAFRSDDPVEHGSAEYIRLSRLMSAGNAARQQRSDLLALAAATKINGKRPGTDAQGPMPRHAHVVRSLKHPDEVQALRRIYGPGFFLVGVVASKEERSRFLQQRKGCSALEVERLLARDDHEDGRGQRTRDTFHLADVFIALDDFREMKRFIALAFGAPYLTPTSDEHAMFLAFSASLRSADLSRQVGAVVVSKVGDVIAVGANDVPAAGGGLYWPGDGDQRDFVLGKDTNESQRTEIVEEVVLLLSKDEHVSTAEMAEGVRRLRNAAVMDVTEYGRAVHAGMEALMACARSGISTRDTTLFCTTFPCHNCAKHLIAAGVARVVYVEPYPKSRAAAMYPESIEIGGARKEGRVSFEPFRGVGPRRFFDLFSMGLSSGYPVRRKKNGTTRAWEPTEAEVRVPMLPTSYIIREQVAAQKVEASSQGEDANDEEAGS